MLRCRNLLRDIERLSSSQSMRCLRFHAALFALIALIGISGCAQYSTVRIKRPSYQPVTPAGKVIARAFSYDRSKPLVALGEYLDAARIAALELQSNPGDALVRRDYNFALSRVMETINVAKLDPWTRPLRVPAPGGGEYQLTRQPDPRPQWNPALYDFTPANQFDCSGTYVSTRTVKDGLGAPLVAVGRAQQENFHENFALPRTYYGVTVIARFEGAGASRRCVLSFEDPLATETVRLNGRIYPLAADFTVPLAVLLARENPKKLELTRLLNPQKYAETARISRLQPYDPRKTVVLCVHGLMDTPATWAPLINTLRGDPDIRQHCQFWFYSYPSGYPYPYSAAIMREQLDAVEKRFPLRKKIVLIGHSMGGCISRLMITDSGDKIWLGMFGKPPSQVHLTPGSRKMLTSALIFRHRPEVGRVIFISAPHRGSDLASNWLGRIGSSLVRAPKTLLSIGGEVRNVMTLDAGALKLKRIPNSVDTLAPNNRFVKLLATIPITPGIPYHSIIGDRGKGDTPNSSDGIVPYWSSHLDGAQSEIIVPSGHNAHQNPQAIAEVRRILLLHLNSSR